MKGSMRKLRSITSCIEDPLVKIIGYADDCTIYLAHANMAVIPMKLQDTVYNLGNWSEQSGFRFSQAKTVIIHFYGPKIPLERSRY
jgi:hypothetical protein